MKLFPNPITSPSRLDKFQSPLKRSLRKNGVESRSRGRSRLSPMFIRKKNEVAATETQEPSSPKVTCFGQVRVRKSKSIRHTKHRCCCCSIRKALFCGRFDGKSKPSRSFRSVWERWFLFMKVGFRSRRRESIQTIREVTEEDDEEENTEEEEEEEEAGGGGGRRDDEVVVISSSPPKNALLLMRSKSESYRPSSLANLFWGSPVSVKDSEEIRIPEIITEQRSDGEEEEDEERPTSEKELTCRDSTSESRKNGSKIEEKLGLCEEVENSSSSSSRSSSTMTNIRSSMIEDERRRNPVPALPPIVLRRSKSEPASKISVKLD